MRSRTESSTTALACCLLRLVEAKLRTDKAHCAARIVRIEAALGDNLDRVKFVLSSGSIQPRVLRTHFAIPGPDTDFVAISGRETPWFGGRLAHYLPPREVFAGICSETACGSPSGGSEMCSWDASEEELVVGLELEARAPRFVCETWPMRDDRRGSIPQVVLCMRFEMSGADAEIGVTLRPAVRERSAHCLRHPAQRHHSGQESEYRPLLWNPNPGLGNPSV